MKAIFQLLLLVVLCLSSLISFNAESACLQGKYVEGTFIVKKVSFVTQPAALRGCKIELEDKKSQTYDVYSSNVICTFKPKQKVELGLQEPCCDTKFGDTIPTDYDTDSSLACFTKQKWFVMSYTHMNEDGERVVSFWNYDFKNSMPEIDHLDPAGMPARVAKRALEALDVENCYTIGMYRSEQIDPCRRPIEQIIEKRSVAEKNPDLCQRVRSHSESAYYNCLEHAIPATGKAELCEKYLYYPGDLVRNQYFRHCLEKTASPSYCRTIPDTKIEIKNLCFHALYLCDDLSSEPDKFECMTGGENIQVNLARRGVNFLRNYCDGRPDPNQREQCWLRLINRSTRSENPKETKKYIDGSKLLPESKWKAYHALVINEIKDKTFAVSLCSQIGKQSLKEECMRIALNKTYVK